MHSPIYMDNHATTQVDPRVVEAILPFFTQRYGNAASVSHAFGWEAREAVDAARESIAEGIGAEAREIVFTSGATESNNLAIRGVAEHARRRGDHMISVATEHKAVLDPLATLARRGFHVTLLDVAQDGEPIAGRIDVGHVADALRDDTALVSVMLANNEIGVFQPLAEIGAVCRERGVPLHCDATQAVGKTPIDVAALGVDLMSFSAHKIYGPKGVGALFVRRRPAVRLEAQILGGGHEGRLRSGTLNTPGIVGLAKALELCLEDLSGETARIGGLRNRLYQGVAAAVSGVALCGPALDATDDDGQPLRLTGNLNLRFEQIDGEALLMSIGQLAASSGAACTSADPQPSHVLRALGLSEEATRGSLRFGLGRFNTPEEVERAIAMVAEAVERLRKMSSFST